MRFLHRQLSFPTAELSLDSSRELSTKLAIGRTASMGGNLNHTRNKPKRDTNKKSAKFDVSLNMCNKTPANHGHSKECWYTQEEFIELQASVRLLRQKVKSSKHQKTERHYLSVLSDVYQICSEVEDEGLLEAGCLKPMEEKHLIQGMTHSTMIGLERAFVELLSLDYNARRKRTWKALKQLQKVLPASDFKAETIRRHMESMSLPSRVFAREMGKAVWTAVSACDN